MAKEKKKQEWEVTTNRFVAFLDIMGFKDMVMRSTHGAMLTKMIEITAAYHGVQNKVDKGMVGKYAGVNLFVTSFSDSVVIFSDNDSEKSFDLFLQATRHIFTTTVHSGIPMKGAIAYGETTVDRNKNLYFGQSIIDAYLLQEEVNYYGVVFHNTVDLYLHENSIDPFSNRTFVEKTHLKTGQIIHRNLNWFETLQFQGEGSVDQIFDEVSMEWTTRTSGDPRKYIDNTSDMYQRYKNLVFSNDKN